jgi:hypothetical protein
MTIRRDDLVAAAALDLLQYRQIDPLLVFLLQRDVRAKRQALLVQARPSRLQVILSYAAVLLAVLTGALFAVLFTTRAVQSMGVGALFFFTLLYAIGALGLAFWFKRIGYCGRVRMLSAVIMTSVPLAVFALQHATG